MMRIRSCPTAAGDPRPAVFREAGVRQGDRLLCRQLEERILAGQVFPVDMYLALRTSYNIEEWAASPASLANKRRLCWWMMQDAADGTLVEHAFLGGVVYACPAMEQDFAIGTGV